MDKNLTRSSFPSFWISPDINLFNMRENRVMSRARHERCSSGKVSPYQDQSSILKLKSAIQTITRKQSPTNSTKFKKFSNKSTSFKSKPVKVTKKKATKPVKKSKQGKGDHKLKELDKKVCKKAPKIFENQIFCDIYDGQGNHDRVMETFEVSESRTRIDEDSLVFEKFIVASNLETEQHEVECQINAKPPENSFLADTERKPKNDHMDLFAKLQSLAAERKLTEDY